MMPDHHARLLVVEDERIVALNLQQRLRTLGYEVAAVASSGAEAIEHAQRLAPDLVLMDIRIEGDLDGIETATRINSQRRVPVVYLTAHSEESTIERARQTAPYGYLLKPFSEREMHATIQMALARRSAELELEASQSRLRESEHRFRQLAENIREVFFLVASDNSHVLYISPAYESIWGRTCESLYEDPRSWMTPIHPDDAPRVRAALEARAVTGQYEIEFRVRRPDGTERWISSRGFPIRDQDGRIYRIAGVAEDVTQRVTLANVLRQSESALRRAQQMARLGHVVTRPDGSFEAWSDTLPQLLGLAPADMPATTRAWLELVHPEDRARFRERALAAAASRERTDQEYRLRTAQGAWIDLQQVMEPVEEPPDAQGRTRWFSTLQDVTDKNAVERELRESKRRFESMHDNAQLISIMLDRTGKILYCNAFLERLTGYRCDELVGRDWFSIFVPPGDTRRKDVFEPLLDESPRAWHHESTLLTRDGDLRLVSWSNTVLRSPDGVVYGTASLGEDITERKRAEEEVRRLNASLERRVAERTAELEAANRDLESYDRTVAHDLRAPVRHIEAFGSLLQADLGDSLAEPAKGYLERMLTASRRMNDLVNDLFVLSTLDRGELQRGEVDMSTLAHQVFNTLLRNSPGREVERAFAPGLIVRADPGLLKALLENLLGNAFKFTARTPAACIELGCWQPEEDPAVYFVRDNGAGFDMERAGRMFEPFQRFHPAAQFEGTGLGLATVQRIVSRHGGRVWAEGVPGKGATFYFTLSPPLAAPARD